MNSRRILVASVILAAIAGGAYFLHRSRSAESAAQQTAQQTAANRPVAVQVTKVVRRDVPVYLEGIGSATAFYTITVKTQVDGRLDKVFFKEGQFVKKGELLAQIDPRPFAIQLQQAQAAIARDDAQLKNAKLNLDRYVALREQNLIPQQQVTDQAALHAQLAATVQLDQVQANSARLQLDYARIVSPIDGVTGVRLVDPGNIVSTTDTTGLVIVTQLDPIAVLFTLPQDNLPQVAKHMENEPLAVDAMSRDGKQLLASGQVTLIDNQINQSTATIRLKAVFPNPKRHLWPNQFVKARLLLEKRPNVLVIPTVAVQRGPKGSFVYVVGGDQKVEMRDVKMSTTDGDDSVVDTGLNEGDTIVTDGQHLLRPGASITVRQSSGAPAGSGAPAASGSAPAASSAWPATSDRSVSP